MWASLRGGPRLMQPEGVCSRPSSSRIAVRTGEPVPGCRTAGPERCERCTSRGGSREGVRNETRRLPARKRLTGWKSAAMVRWIDSVDPWRFPECNAAARPVNPLSPNTLNTNRAGATRSGFLMSASSGSTPRRISVSVSCPRSPTATIAPDRSAAETSARTRVRRKG